MSGLTVRIGHLEDRLPLLQQRPDQVWRVGVIYQGRALGRERRLRTDEGGREGGRERGQRTKQNTSEQQEQPGVTVTDAVHCE